MGEELDDRGGWAGELSSAAAVVVAHEVGIAEEAALTRAVIVTRILRCKARPGLERGRQRWGELGRQAEIHYEESRMGTVQTGR